MPRVSTKTTEDDVKPAPRKRAVRRTVAKDAGAQELRRVRVSRKVVETKDNDVTFRKAPTGLAEASLNSNKKKKTIVVTIIILIVVVLVAALIGTTDDGQINVTARIEEESKRQPQANVSVDGNSSTDANVIPVQNTPPPPEAISGLQGRGVGTAPVLQPESETISEATTTDEVADGSVEGAGVEETISEEINQEE